MKKPKTKMSVILIPEPYIPTERDIAERALFIMKSNKNCDSFASIVELNLIFLPLLSSK